MTLFKDTILSNELSQRLGQEVSIRGWIHTVRTVGAGLAFLIIRDRHGLSQAVLEDPEEIKKLEGMMMGTVLIATGKVAEMPKGKFKFELQNASIEILNPVTDPSPIDISKHEINADHDTIHENKVVALRHHSQSKIFKVAAIAEKYMRDFFDQNDFTQINSPKILAFPTEGGAEVFSFDYFGRTAYLAQSPQFYKQIMVPIFERVYEIGTVYRAEKSNTSRHMSEILMLDMEMGFIDSFEDVLDMTEKFFHYIINQTRGEAEDLLVSLNAKRPVLTEKLPRIAMQEVHELMFKATGEDYRKDLDITPSEEKFICEYSAKNLGSEAVLVVDFPREDAKFYHHQNAEHPEFAERADLLFRGVELATITQREVNYQKILQNIQDHGYDIHNPGLKHYLDAFKYGMPDEGGFGFGIARFIQKLIGLTNVKQAVLFPRDIGRISP